MITLTIKLMTLVALVKLLKITEKPFLCSGIYAVGVLALYLLYGVPLPVALISAVIGLALASLYFWLLNYYKTGWVFWIVFVFGLLVGLV